MEMLPPVKPTKNSCTRKKHTKNKLKVVYISSPMKVKTSVSRFRALVQELTGRDSDISRYDVACFDPVAPVVATTTGAQGGLVVKKVVESCSEQGMHFSGSESIVANDVFRIDHDPLEGMMFPSYSLYESCFQ